MKNGLKSTLMSSSKRGVAGMKERLRLSWQPELQSSSLVVGWSVDAGKLGRKVTDYLNRKLGGKSFGEIEPTEFFPLGGVAVEDDLVQFPESKFYSCPGKNFVVFRSDPPSYEWYKFLSLILDAAEHYCHTMEIYTIGGMVSLGSHTTPRELIGTFNSPELKKAFSHYNLSRGLDYETPPIQRPTLNSFLLWAAKRRNIPGVSLWVPIPFYLVAVDDPKARRRVLEFFNQRFNFGIDLSDLDEEIRQQDEKIAEVRNSFPDIDESISRLESNLRLSEEENQKLVQEIGKFLREKRG
jgi:proteasome assembly chaperone (PAC2) family protein